MFLDCLVVQDTRNSQARCCRSSTGLPHFPSRGAEHSAVSCWQPPRCPSAAGLSAQGSRNTATYFELCLLTASPSVGPGQKELTRHNRKDHSSAWNKQKGVARACKRSNVPHPCSACDITCWWQIGQPNAHIAPQNLHSSLFFLAWS